MEATVAAPAEPVEAHDGVSEVTRSTEELFQWAGYVHVGVGAEECEHHIDGQCRNTEHFHAWVCLPNPYQIRDINDKAQAAKARKRRALRDREPDAYAILEDQLDDFREDARALSDLKDLIAQRRIEVKLLDIVGELAEDERFEHHEQDAEEFRRLNALPEDERDAEDFERLQADMLAYTEALQAEIDKRQAGERAQLDSLSVDDIIYIERKDRIDNIVNEIYLHTYYTWTMYACARVPATEGFPSTRIFSKPEDLKNAPPEVVVALREKIRVLEQRTVKRSEAAGN